MLGRRSSQPIPPEQGAPGVILGKRLAGDPVLPTRGADFVLPFEQLRRHVVVLGASGSGKTETAMRIAHGAAAGSEARIFYLDAKGDRQAAERFLALMAEAGHRARVFPNQRFDAWRGDWRAIVNRLLEVIEFAEEGPAAYYRDIAKSTLQLACRHPEGPPRSSAELLDRLDFDRLLDAHGPTSAILALPRDKVSQVRMRYEAFFGQLGTLLDGGWCWEDTDAAYFLLDSAALGEDASTVARLLFADFAHYFTQRKRRQQPCLLLADEFSALSRTTDVATKVEQARSFNTGLVLAPQVISGMGSVEQRQRILGSIELVIAHALNDPDEIAALAGERRLPELTHRIEAGWRGRDGFARLDDRPRLPADRLRELSPGTAWMIRRGRAAKVGVHRAPALSVDLPFRQPAETRPEPRVTTPPKEIAYLEED